MGKLGFWKVSVSQFVVGTPLYEVPNVQGVSFTYGRNQPTDDFPAATGTVNGILPDSLPALAKEIGSVVFLDLMDSSDPTTRIARYYMNVKDLSRSYGTTPNLDTWSMSIVGNISIMSERQLTSDYTTTAGNGTLAQAQNLLNTYAVANNPVGTGDSFVSATTFTKGTYVSDIVQTLLRTEQGRIVDCVFDAITLYQRSSVVSGSTYDYYFSDNPATSALEYTSVDFLNDGDFLANTVIVEPDGLAAVSVGTTRPTLSFATLDRTTVQATDLSQYIKETLNLNTVRPLSITYIYDAQGTPFVYPLAPGLQVWVELRGVTYKCIVEGAVVSANPSATQVTLNLSSSEAYRFLRLDNAVFGTLDNNRLGF
jgi:hypothetical protein